MKTLHIPVTPELHDLIHQAAAKALPHTGRPVSSWVRQTLEREAQKTLK